MSRDEWLHKIQSLSFAKTECELYLDTHPECKHALDYYRNIVEQLDQAMSEYQSKFEPLWADASLNKDRWTWIDGAWPWQNEENKGKKKA